MSLPRIAWLVTTVVCLIGGGLLLIFGFQGYAAVSVVVALAAAINVP